MCAKCQENTENKTTYFGISDFQVDLTVRIDLSNFNKMICGKLLKFAPSSGLNLSAIYALN